MKPTNKQFVEKMMELPTEESHTYAHYWQIVEPDENYISLLIPWNKSEEIQTHIVNWGKSGVYDYPKDMLIIWHKEPL